MNFPQRANLLEQSKGRHSKVTIVNDPILGHIMMSIVCDASMDCSNSFIYRATIHLGLRLFISRPKNNVNMTQRIYISHKDTAPCFQQEHVPAEQWVPFGFR